MQIQLGVGMKTLGVALMASQVLAVQPQAHAQETQHTIAPVPPVPHDGRPVLVLRAGNPNSQPARRLHAAIQRRMPMWRILTAPGIRGTTIAQRVAEARSDLLAYDAVMWVESYPERLVLLMRADGHPRAIAIRRTHPRWDERAAIYVEHYVRRILRRAALRADGVRSRWFSVMPRNGWALRAEGFVGLSPRQGAQLGSGFDQARVGGGGIRLGRWLTRFLRLDLRLHLGSAEDDLGPQGGLGMQLALVSPTGFRLGAALSLEMVIASDIDPWIGDRYGWVGFQAWLPMVLGVDAATHGAWVIQVGPTFTKPPNQDFAVGVIASMGIEFDLGHDVD